MLKARPDLVGEYDQKVRTCIQRKHAQQGGCHARPDSRFDDQGALHVKPLTGVDQAQRDESALPELAG